MNVFKIESSKISAIFAGVVGLIFTVGGLIEGFREDTPHAATLIVGGIILMNVATLLGNQVKLQSHLTRTEDQIDKRVNNS